MKLSFARNRLNALLRTQIFGAVGPLVPRITDMFVSGSVVGVDALADRHGGRAKRIMAETSITVGKEGVQVVFRATGDMEDLTDGDAPVSSIRTFVIAGLVRVVQSRQYLNTIGCNRAMFTFTPDSISAVAQPKERTVQSCN